MPEREHAHLRLARQLPSGTRVTRPPRFRRPVRYPDQPAHAEKLERDLARLRAIHARRTNVLGVDPENVAVLAFNQAPEESQLRRSGLAVLEWFSDRVVVTAPGDPGMGKLAERLALYKAGPQERVEAEPAEAPTEENSSLPASSGEADEGGGEERPRTARFQALFDRVEEVRELGRDEVLTPSAVAAISAAAEGDVLLLDIQCWCPEDEADARARHDETAAAVSSGGGRVLDSSLRHRSGLSLLRVEATASLAGMLADVPHVRRVDTLPRPLVSHPEAVLGGSELLPLVLPPLPNAPVIGVVDSGVQSGHPLIGPAFAGAWATPSLEADADESGHGTFVASLALYGSIEPLVEGRGTPARAAGRLFSLRVLDGTDRFPDTELWENDLIAALEAAAEAGARVVNLSLGDSRHPYAPDRPTPLAAAVDDFVRTHDVVVVVSAGNMAPGQHELDSPDADYTERLLDAPDAGILDPASSALSLTVGALGADDGQGAREARPSVDDLPIGGENLPSPLTRSGPGAANMIKPEVAAPGGHAALTGLSKRLRVVSSVGVLGAAGTKPGRVLAVDAGTSFSAPLVSHAAARVFQENPGFSARSVRALVLASVQSIPSFLEPDGAEARTRERRLVGYGRPQAAFAAHSTDHRAVLLAEESVPVDDVHLYRVPIPNSFFESSGWRRVAVALAFDPNTRATRLDYLSTRMQVQVYRGVSVDEVADAYLAERQAAPSETDAVDAEGAADDAVVAGPSTLSGHKVDLQPADRVRSRGAHVFGEKTYKQRLRPEDGTEYVIAVQNVNRWEVPGTVLPYSLAVVLERDRQRAPIYVELRAALEVEVPVEVQLR